jgi:hypothetical protein
MSVRHHLRVLLLIAGVTGSGCDRSVDFGNTLDGGADALPGAPTQVIATAGNASATVSWTAPALGKASLSFYLVTSSPEGITATAVDTTTTIPGLTNGTTYTFTVTATTALGTGAASVPSNPVTPSASQMRAVPSAPTGVSAMAGVGEATVSWTTPQSNGGSPLTGYVVVPSVAGVVGAATMVADPSATHATIAGLTNGSTYTFTVAATNAIGMSAASAPSNPVMPVAAMTVPDAPTTVVASAGVSQAALTWSLPVNNGGSPITGFAITPYLGATPLTPVQLNGGALTSGMVTGLTNGMAYTFTVAAINGIGAGAASAHSNAVTPVASATVPGAPTGVTAASAGPSKISVTWVPPASNGGSALTGFSVTPSAGGVSQPSLMVIGGNLTQTVVSGLTDGTAYTFTVSASNAVGSGPSSTPSNAAVPGALACTVEGFPSVPVLIEKNTALTDEVQADFVATADLNGDAKLDVVHVNHDGNTVSVYLAKGSGAFKDPVDYPTGAGPRGVELKDVNGDGKVDIVSANSGANSISVLRGNGDGTFQAMINTTTGMDPRTVAMADFDNDGKLDAVVADWGSNSISLLRGVGDGSFHLKVDYAAGNNPSSLAVRDFNGDGKPDVAAANYMDSSLTVFLNTGGTFAAGVTYLTGVYPVSIVSADFNGDNKADLVTANHDGDSISVLLGVGNGTFQTATRVDSGISPQSVVAADFNADGKVDLALANFGSLFGSGTLSILFGNGNGTFAAKVDYLVGRKPESVTAGDFNGDGKTDLAVANYYSSEISVLINSGGGSFPQRHVYDWVGTVPGTVAMADFNHDGKVDVIASCDGVCVYPGNGDGTLRPMIRQNTLTSGDLAIADFNMDGWLDVAVDLPDLNHSGSGEGLAIMLNRAGTAPVPTDGGVAPIFWPYEIYSPITASVSLAAGDLNGDTRPDLVVSNADHMFSALLGNGDGTFQPQKNSLTDSFGDGKIALADFNKDGKLDVMVAAFDNQTLWEFLGNGDGTFQPHRTFTMGAAMSQARGISVGDLNADGAPDVVVPFDNDLVAVRLGNGDGTFKPEVDYPAGSKPGELKIADVDGDGKLDLVVPNSLNEYCASCAAVMCSACSSTTVSVLLGKGDGTFQPRVSYETGNSPGSATAGDLNGDGKPEIVVVNDFDGTLEVLISACF